MDLHYLEDEELVRLAQRADSHEALDALVLRHWASVMRWVERKGPHLRLSAEDVEDGGQHVFCAFLGAVILFKPDQPERAGRCSFRSFLHRKIISSLLDFARCLWRERSPPPPPPPAALGGRA